MISIYSSSIDELKNLWKKLENDYDLIEKIHVSPEKDGYLLILDKNQRKKLSPLLKNIADKIIEMDDMHELSFFTNFTFEKFVKRVEGEINGKHNYPGIRRLTHIWDNLTLNQQEGLYEYLLKNYMLVKLNAA